MGTGTKEVIRILKQGGVAVMPSDTILGIMGSALRSRTVERIYRLRGRNRKKPLIVLIKSSRSLIRFGIRPSPHLATFLRRVWPGPVQPSRKASAGAVSVVLPCPGSRFRYLHRGTGTIAFRVPQPPALRKLLTKTGPLVAPSANREGEPPARTVAEARRTFGDKVDIYMSGRSRTSAPSLVVRVLRH